jgi:2-dehydro-3-deoxygluconokinase/2-dehydro-3-deoxygalactonokinase
MLDIVTLGEPMVQLNALTTGPLRHVGYFERHVAGAEANVCVAASRMGLRAGLISKVGDDEFGKCILATLRGEGVDVTRLEVEKKGFTGVYFVQRGYPVPGRSKVFYYRKGSSASKLGPEDLDENYIISAKLLYLTGITPALSRSCLRACAEAADIAKHAGLKVAFDTNIRPSLWVGQDPRKALLSLLFKADIVFTESSETRLLMDEGNPAKAARKLMAKGASMVVMKGGEKETVVYSDDQVYRQKAFDVPVVDPVGAGDAFAGVFVSGYLKGWNVKECLAAGSAAGSLVVMTRGDQENIPTESDIADFLKAQEKKR